MKNSLVETKISKILERNINMVWRKDYILSRLQYLSRNHNWWSTPDSILDKIIKDGNIETDEWTLSRSMEGLGNVSSACSYKAYIAAHPDDENNFPDPILETEFRLIGMICSALQYIVYILNPRYHFCAEDCKISLYKELRVIEYLCRSQAAYKGWQTRVQKKRIKIIMKETKESVLKRIAEEIEEVRNWEDWAYRGDALEFLNSAVDEIKASQEGPELWEIIDSYREASNSFNVYSI